MPRLIRKTAILARVETTYGTDAAPAGATDAILISNATFETIYNNVPRDLIRPYYGNSDELVGTRFMKANFTVELANSGTAGTAPAWGRLLRACGFAEANLTTPTRVEYTPVSGSFSSLTIDYHVDGTRRKILGAMGTCSIDLSADGRPMASFEFWGLDGGVTATADPTAVFTAWRLPQVVTAANSGTVTFGGTYTAGAITAGTTFLSRGLQITVGNECQMLTNLGVGGQRISITNRSVTATAQLDLTPAQEVTLRSDINTNAVTSMSMTHGTGAGVGLIVFAPAVQRINPRDTDYNGELHTQLDMRLMPTGTGNDELRVVCL